MKLFTRLFLPIALAFTLISAGPVGCSKTTLSPTGVYQGDTFLYNAEKTIVNFHKQCLYLYAWEIQFRSVLPVEVSRAVDFLRLNEKKWIDTANAFHDAYLNSPTPENRDRLKLGLNLIDTALAEAVKYLSANKRVAPNTGLPK